MRKNSSDLSLNQDRKDSRPKWLVDDIVSDFEMLDEWNVPLITQKEYSLEEVLTIVFAKHKNYRIMNVVSKFLFWLRGLLGGIFRWDRDVNSLPIPGCTEKSVKDRLQQQDLFSEEPNNNPYEDNELTEFQTIYSLRFERLLELSNNTVHALLHYSLLRQDDHTLNLCLSIFVKTRGRLGDLYMKLITPFRHFIVYPAMMGNIEKTWHLYQSSNKNS